VAFLKERQEEVEEVDIADDVDVEEGPKLFGQLFWLTRTGDASVAVRLEGSDAHRSPMPSYWSNGVKSAALAMM
jgi:hypothetical protein